MLKNFVRIKKNTKIVKKILRFLAKSIFFLIFIVVFSIINVAIILNTKQIDSNFFDKYVSSYVQKYVKNKFDYKIDNIDSIKIYMRGLKFFINLNKVTLTKKENQISIRKVDFSVNFLKYKNFLQLNVESVDYFHNRSTINKNPTKEGVSTEIKNSLILVSKILKILNLVNIKKIETHVNDTFIAIKNLTFEIDKKKNVLKASTDILINAENSNLSFNCIYEGQNLEDLSCGLDMNNIDAKEIYNLIENENKKTIPLSGKYNFYSTFNLNLENGENFLNNIYFGFTSKSGRISDKRIFEFPIIYKDLQIVGNITKDFRRIDLYNMSVNLANGEQISGSSFIIIDKIKNEHFAHEFSNVKTFIEINSDKIDLKKIRILWPSALSHNSIRDWVVNRVKNGKILNSKTKIFLEYNGASRTTNLKDVHSNIKFGNLELNYDNNFPTVKNAFGDININKNSLKIEIKSANVLNSTIQNGFVGIENFSKPELLIKAKVLGDAMDGILHINYNSLAESPVLKILNDSFLKENSTQTNLEIHLPLEHGLTFKDITLKIDSNIQSINSEYIQKDSGVRINVIKEKGSESIMVNANFDTANIALNDFDIVKNSGENLALKLEILVDDKNVIIKNGSLYGGKDDNHRDIGFNVNFTKKENSLKSFNIKYTTPKNNFFANYLLDKNISNINLYGENLYLHNPEKIFEKFRSNKTTTDSSITNYPDKSFFNIKVNLKNLTTENANDRLKNIYVDIFCNENLNCQKLNLIANDSGIAIYKSKFSAGDNSKNIDYGREFAKEYDIRNLDYSIHGKIENFPKLLRIFGVGNDSLIYGNLEFYSFIQDKNRNVSSKIKNSDDRKFYNRLIFDNVSVRKKNMFWYDLLMSANIFNRDKSKYEVFDISRAEVDLIVANDEFLIKNGKIFSVNLDVSVSVNGKVSRTNRVKEVDGYITPLYKANNTIGLGYVPILGKVFSSDKSGLLSLYYTYRQKDHWDEPRLKINPVSILTPSFTKKIFRIGK